MSACFQRLDGKPIDADVIYRYRLIDAIADGNAKNPRLLRFAPQSDVTTYELTQPDGTRIEVVGRDALLKVLRDERKMAQITAKSDASIRHLAQAAKRALVEQSASIAPIRPRVLFAALGESHAHQIARVAGECGIKCGVLHYSMPEGRIRQTLERFESESGDLQGIVQLKMLGQGYDFPPICVVVPVRSYGSFGEFYQFIGRGVRVLRGVSSPEDQFLDIIYHGELSVDEHIDALYRENEMDPLVLNLEFDMSDELSGENPSADGGTRVASLAPTARVLFERGEVEKRILHDEDHLKQRHLEREREALAQRYAVYARKTASPVSFDQFALVMSQFRT